MKMKDVQLTVKGAVFPLKRPVFARRHTFFARRHTFFTLRCASLMLKRDPFELHRTLLVDITLSFARE